MQTVEVQPPPSGNNYPTEPKVRAARMAALLAGVVVSFLIKTLPFLNREASLLLEIVTDLILGAILFGAVWLAGWKAKHVNRPQVVEPGQPGSYPVQ